LLNRYTAQKLYRGFESLPLRSAVSVKTKKNRTLLVAAALLGAVGCGGNNDTGAASTYVYESARPVVVPATACTLVRGPIAVGNGTMKYAIDDASGATPLRALIISDSIYSVAVSARPTCEFAAGAALDVSFVGSHNGEIGVVADAYDFVVGCQTDADCAFDLTWSATY
jgi:hypothetical protein